MNATRDEEKMLRVSFRPLPESTRDWRPSGPNGDGEDQAESVDEEMAPLAFDLIARVIARRVDARAPFSSPFKLWLSITPALGETSRPTRDPGP